MTFMQIWLTIGGLIWAAFCCFLAIVEFEKRGIVTLGNILLWFLLLILPAGVAALNGPLLIAPITWYLGYRFKDLVVYKDVRTVIHNKNKKGL